MATLKDREQAKVGQALVLSCMDLRVVDDVVKYLNETLKLENEFDLVAMAGASLGASTPLKPHWQALFWDHVDLAIGLHQVKEVIIVEHQDCGAFKAFDAPESRRAIHGTDDEAKQALEEQAHKETALALREAILQRKAGVIQEVRLLYAAANAHDPLKFDVRPFR